MIEGSLKDLNEDDNRVRHTYNDSMDRSNMMLPKEKLKKSHVM